MEKEISSGAMLGIVLIALAAVIGLGFGVFAIAKGTANEGVVNMQDSLGAVSTQQFNDFDQKIISGTQVTAALKNFEGKPVAVLISSKALLGNQPISSETDHPKAYIIAAGATKDSVEFINYNAILAANETSALSAVKSIDGGDTLDHGTSLTGSDVVALKNGVYVAKYGFALDTTGGGNVAFDNSTGGIYKSGNAEFVSSGAKYQANLIKDSSGTIMGVAFRQL